MVLAILRALAAAVRRDLSGFGAMRTNNFFLFIVLLVAGAVSSGVAPVSAYPFLVLLAVLLFFPIAGDPLEKIPRVRFALWPLNRRSRLALRLFALALSPVLWFAVVLLIREGRNVFLPVAGVIAAAAVRAQATAGDRGFPVGRAIPSIPSAYGILVARHLRTMLALLDTWLALVVALLGTAWRIASHNVDPAAPRMLSILVGFALSTQLQSSGGLDETRYKLLPIAAWRAILVRDLAYLLVTAVLTIAFDPIAALTFGTAAIAAARYPSLHSNLRVDRWRFSSGRVLFCSLQMIVGAALAFAGPLGFAIAILLWVASVWWAGRSKLAGT